MSCCSARLSTPKRSSFDFILLDTQPVLGSLSGMALLGADGVVIPALAADLDVRGAGKPYDLVESEVPGLRDHGRDARSASGAGEWPATPRSGCRRIR
jgi:cellulose biosynthesis protein BcsQ